MKRLTEHLVVAFVLFLAACQDEPAPESAECAACDVPTEIGALQAYLAAGTYSTFAAESAVHDSGVHGQVRTFMSPKLAAALASPSGSTPIGAASVKELHADGALAGWTVMVKVREGEGGQGWWWYETFSTDPEAEPAVAGLDHESCVSCHASGVDGVRTAWPLR